MRKNKSLIVILLILVVGVIGLTLAYFTNTASVSNEFKSKEYGTTVTEEFTSPDNWTPGTTTDKSLTVTNSGQVDEAVRVSYVESWTSKNSNVEGDLELTQNGNTAAIINWANTSDWTTVTENGKTYKYYNYKLQPNETTSTLLDSVTFNSAITNSSNCVTEETSTGKTIKCTSTGNGYDGATYKLVFTVETVQYDKYKDAWNNNVNISSMKPMNASALALKSNPISITNYLDGNIHQMYTFEHEATEQTPALTDYRYIGNDPYNYVYFNCDDLNNQNEETCEVWRIIGVFDVDDGTGNYQKRIKLVRGSALTDAMAWNTNNINDWHQSSLKNFLNENFLTLVAQSHVEEVKFYLSSVSGKNNAEDMYASERGKNTYNSIREMSWKGVVALMYPSDVYMTYGKM